MIVAGLLEQSIALQLGALVHAYEDAGLNKVEAIALALEYIVRMAETLGKAAERMLEDVPAPVDGETN